MDGIVLSLTLDIVVLLCLGFTIYFAIRLSKNLNDFRDQRNAFRDVIAQLSGNIVNAEGAIENLKVASKESGEDLQNRVRDATGLIDELQIMIEAGNSLAQRLETLAGQSRDHVQSTGEMSNDKSKAMPSVPAENLDRPFKPDADEGGNVSFFIQDREYDESDDDTSASARDTDIPDELQSEAEKELFKALRANKSRKPSSGSF